VESGFRLNRFYGRPGDRGSCLVGYSTLNLATTDGLSMKELGTRKEQEE
jgi:hypothetical protein